jgi:hypothetical protein
MNVDKMSVLFIKLSKWMAEWASVPLYSKIKEREMKL